MGIVYTPKKAKLQGNHYYDIKEDAWTKLAERVYADIYPLIWDLINNKKYFRTNKKYDVLYAMENAQHVFYLWGRVFDNAGGMIFMQYLCSLLQKGRLRKHVYFEDIDESCYISINITPYINIRYKRDSAKKDAMIWHYNVYSFMHTMGFNSYMDYRYQSPSNNPAVQLYETFQWNEGVDHNVHVTMVQSKKNPNYGKFWIMTDTPQGYHDGNYIEAVLAQASSALPISFGRFDIFTYRFLRYLKHINSHMKYTVSFQTRKTLYDYILHAINGNPDLKLNTWE